ncbi:MAG: hypothetical protein J3Q66DRAFT_426334, partial [Benniella sp.]
HLSRHSSLLIQDCVSLLPVAAWISTTSEYQGGCLTTVFVELVPTATERSLASGTPPFLQLSILSLFSTRAAFPCPVLNLHSLPRIGNGSQGRLVVLKGAVWPRGTSSGPQGIIQAGPCRHVDFPGLHPCKRMLYSQGPVLAKTQSLKVQESRRRYPE